MRRSKITTSLLIGLLTASALSAQQIETPPPPGESRPTVNDRETTWSNWLASPEALRERIAGEPEYRLPDASRVDIYSTYAGGHVAWEVEWSSKWPQSIGQACLYRELLGCDGGVVLLVGKESAEAEKRNFFRCFIACQSAGLRLRLVNVHKPTE